MSKVLFFSFVVGLLLLLDSCCCWVINDINSAMLPESTFYKTVLNDEGVDMDAQADGARRINIIFPGTKWCGAGNIADNYDDLGSEKEADICCRAHDNCPDVIPGGETRFNLTNDAFYSRLSCECDVNFLTCLRSANTRVAKYIGVIYFDALQTKCFKKDYLITKCNKKGGWFKTKCVDYSFDRNGKPVFQWFDVPSF